jgi:REP element-mobilizing transposase RayT
VPGATYLVTRRCAQRQFLLRPSALTNGIFLYVLAVAARRFRIRVHAFCVMSNHYHLVVTDPDARLPAFSQYLDALVARAVNSTLGRWEAFWAPSTYSAVALASPGDVVAKVAYVVANPVTAGLVRRGREWPGLWSSPEQIGAPTLLVERPAAFFRPDGDMPTTVELEVTVPPGFDSDEEFGARVAEAVSMLEERERQNLARAGRSFLGARRVASQSPIARPFARERRKGLRPRVAARDRWKRLEVLSRLAEFVTQYREALDAWRSGLRDAEFPAGTYLMRVAHGVACAPA